MASPPRSRAAAFIDLAQKNALPLSLTQYPPQTGFTFENPHSCQHCEREFLEFDVLRPSYLCTQCDWRVPEGPLSRENICNQCLTPFNDDLKFSFSATLQYGLEDALLAAEAGCELYGYLIFCLASDLQDSTNSDEKIPLLDAGKFVLSGYDHADASGAQCNLQVTFEVANISKKIHLPTFEIWSAKNNPSSRYISARPYERDVTSSSSWNFARQCLKTCQELHYQCRWHPMGSTEASISIKDVPSRLIDVHAANSTNVRLAEVSNMSETEKEVLFSSGYATLSYCWGITQPFTLTSKTSNQISGGLDPSQFSQSIQDAIKVTRELGIRYVWVDSLCIYQDEEKDKEYEIARMAEYYGNATVTICAASSLSSDQGFLSRRTPSAFFGGPIRLPLITKDGTNEGDVYIGSEAKRPPEPITTRGWTLQESLLSRRLLIYDARQVYWSCNTSAAGCGGRIVSLQDRVVGNAESLVDNIFPITAWTYRPIRNQWDTIVLDYTRRHLGYPGDKLLAISALVSNIMELSKSRQNSYIYAAGLLVDTTDEFGWLDQLVWCPVDESKTQRLSVYRSPSWSWAAVEGEIIPRSLDAPARALYSQGFKASIKEYFVTPKFPNLPFGSITQGVLTIESKARSLSHCITDPDYTLAVEFPSERPPLHPKGPSATLCLTPDTTQDSHDMKDAVSKKGVNCAEFLLIPTHLDIYGGFGKGIIARKNTCNQLIRVGIFLLMHGTKEGEQVVRIPRPKGIFANTPVSPVKLV